MAPATRTQRLPFRPGFRFSAVDAVAIATAAIATWALWRPLATFALLPPIVLGHFFLFCNVFRVRRSFELAWAGPFAANVVAWLLAGRFSWCGVLLAQSPVTLLLLAIEIASPRYHGIGCGWLKRAREEE